MFTFVFLLIMYPSGSQSQGQAPQEDKLLFSNMLLLFFFFTSFLLVLRHFTTSTSISKRQRFQRRRWRKDTSNISTNSSRYSRNIWYLLPLVPELRVCLCVCVCDRTSLCPGVDGVWSNQTSSGPPSQRPGGGVGETDPGDAGEREGTETCSGQVCVHTHTHFFFPSSFSFLSASPSFSLSPPTGWSSFFKEPIRSRTCLWTVRRN